MPNDMRTDNDTPADDSLGEYDGMSTTEIALKIYIESQIENDVMRKMMAEMEGKPYNPSPMAIINE